MQPSDIHEMSIYIKKVLSEFFGKDWVGGIPVLYGGSVNFENGAAIVGERRVDGLLVGRESLNPEGFRALLRAVDEVKV